MNPIDRARAGFVAQFAHEPDGIAFAPGRVNLIGEHVDYNGGLVLPMPIAAGTAVAWSSVAGPHVEAVALDFANEREAFVPGSPSEAVPGEWRSYLHGMAASMIERSLPLGGARLAISGSIPRGSGLSSSASLCVAVGRALSAAAGVTLPDQRGLALAAQSAEHDYAGVMCGIMDQMAIAVGVPGAALLLDCRTLATQAIALPQDWAVMIVQSGVSRGLVDGHYNARRRDCEAAAATLGVGSLRDATLDQVDGARLDPLVRRRARHVVGEIERTAQAVDAVKHADLAHLGRLFAASHTSLRDDFEVSVPEVDALVAALQSAIGPNGGARMTGGGFGGAVVAILEAHEAERVAAAVAQAYRTPDGTPLQITIERPDG